MRIQLSLILIAFCGIGCLNTQGSIEVLNEKGTTTLAADSILTAEDAACSQNGRDCSSCVGLPGCAWCSGSCVSRANANCQPRFIMSEQCGLGWEPIATTDCSTDNQCHLTKIGLADDDGMTPNNFSYSNVCADRGSTATGTDGSCWASLAGRPEWAQCPSGCSNQNHCFLWGNQATEGKDPLHIPSSCAQESNSYRDTNWNQWYVCANGRWQHTSCYINSVGHATDGNNPYDLPVGVAKAGNAYSGDRLLGAEVPANTCWLCYDQGFRWTHWNCLVTQEGKVFDPGNPDLRYQATGCAAEGEQRQALDGTFRLCCAGYWTSDWGCWGRTYQP
jgi:hypothetical protein